MSGWENDESRNFLLDYKGRIGAQVRNHDRKFVTKEEERRCGILGERTERYFVLVFVLVLVLAEALALLLLTTLDLVLVLPPVRLLDPALRRP